MITFVYCCLCLLIAPCRTSRIESEEDGYSNDSPDILPKVEVQRHKVGADIVIKCNNYYRHFPDNISREWEFKHCKSPHRCVHYDKKDAYKIGGDWQRLNNTSEHLEIKRATEDNLGLYRCLHDDFILKVFVVEIRGSSKFVGLPPEVISLTTSSNSTLLSNAPIVIQCIVQSVKHTEIRWFKESEGQNCEMRYSGHCHRTVVNPTPVYSPSDDIYISKLNVTSSGKSASGTYTCVVLSVYGMGDRNITINVDDLGEDEESKEFFWLLFLIPLCLLLVPVAIWLCFYRRNNKHQLSEHQKQLIKPVVEVDIVVRQVV